MRHTLKADIFFLAMLLVHIGVTIGLFVLDKMGITINLSINQRIIISQLLIIIPVGCYFIFTKTNPIKLVRFKKLDIPTIFMVVLLTILIMPLVKFINSLSMLVTRNTVLDLSGGMVANPLLINLLIMAVLPAIGEELAFRGILFHTYRKNSVLYAGIMSGILFGLIHLNFNQFSYAIVLGIIFALMVEATGSIYATMIAHFIINGNSVIVMKVSNGFLDNFGDSQQLQGQSLTQSLMMAIPLYGVIAMITTMLAIGVYVWIIKHCQREEHMRAVFMIRKGEDKFSLKRVMSIPLILGIVICLMYMVYAQVASKTGTNHIEYNIEESKPDNTL